MAVEKLPVPAKGEGPEEARKSQELSLLIEPILNLVDVIDGCFDMDHAVRVLNVMAQNVSHLTALPFPETLNKAETVQATMETFEAVIDLVRARRNQRDQAMRGPTYTTGEQILRMMGY